MRPSSPSKGKNTHDDAVISLALAYFAAATPRQSVESYLDFMREYSALQGGSEQAAA